MYRISFLATQEALVFIMKCHLPLRLKKVNNRVYAVLTVDTLNIATGLAKATNNAVGLPTVIAHTGR